MKKMVSIISVVASLIFFYLCAQHQLELCSTLAFAASVLIFIIGAVFIYYGWGDYEFSSGNLFLKGILMLITGFIFCTLGFLQIYICIICYLTTS